MGWEYLTHRQFVAWQEWADADLDHPTRGEAYLMQIACEVRRVLSKNPNNIQLDQFRLKWKRRKEAKTKPKQSMARERAGDGPVIIRLVDKDGIEVGRE